MSHDKITVWPSSRKSSVSKGLKKKDYYIFFSFFSHSPILDRVRHDTLQSVTSDLVSFHASMNSLHMSIEEFQAEENLNGVQKSPSKNIMKENLADNGMNGKKSAEKDQLIIAEKSEEGAVSSLTFIFTMQFFLFNSLLPKPFFMPKPGILSNFYQK